MNWLELLAVAGVSIGKNSVRTTFGVIWIRG